jgi:hypothetical protein
MGASVTMAAKNEAKRAFVFSVTVAERLVYPLYLHYRNAAITAALKKDNERSAAEKDA